MAKRVKKLCKILYGDDKLWYGYRTSRVISFNGFA